MKAKAIHLCVIMLMVSSCGKPTEDHAAKIIQVESSLSTPVYIEGDSLWTIEERMAKYGVPGVSIAVIYNGKIAWTKAYGVMHKERKEPVTTATLFQAGSISKPVAAYGALRIAAAGKINAEENVNTYLTTWKLPDNEFTQKQPVHLKHLLSHTGGVTVHGFLGYSPDLPVPSLVQVLNGEPPANSPPIRVDKLPGEGFRYSGGGYSIMQQMLIDVEGKPFPQIMDELVHSPLGMTNSTYEQPLPADKLKLAATGYVPDGTMTKGERHTYPEMAAAGLWTTAEDLAKFAIDVQRSYKGESGAVLGKETATLMLTPYIDEERGLGPGITTIKDEIYFGHGGWDEGFSADMFAHRDKGYGVVVLTNANQPPFISELIRAVALTYKWDDFVATYKPLALTEDDILKVTGRYRFDQTLVGRYRYDVDAVSTITGKDGQLYYQYTGQEPMRMFKVTDSTFIRRERTAQIQIVKNPADGKPHLVFRSGDQPIEFNRPLMAEGEKVPQEWFLEGDYTKALEAYQAFLKANPSDQVINERSLNDRGYNYLFENQVARAKEMFRINMALYPTSANAVDSFAEACMKNGDTEEAIQYYKKTLSMNPDNPNAVKNLKELEGKR